MIAARSAPGTAHAALAEIWAAHREEMLARVATLSRSAIALADGSLDEPLLGKALHAAHQLAGSLGTFGFWHGSESARAIEEILRHPRHLGPGGARRIADLAAGLLAELDGEPLGEAGPAAAPDPTSGPLVLLVDDDRSLTGRLHDEAARRGIRAQVAETPAAARALIDSETPAAVVLDLTFPDGTAAAYDLLSDLAQRTPVIPVLVLTVRDGFNDRIEAARRGAHGFLEKTLSPSDALDQVVQALDRTASNGARVLAIDDDPAVLAVTRAMLEGHGLEVTTLEDPLRLWDELKRVSPALLLLDLDMPGASGIELCRVLRNDPRWAAVPILILTARQDPAIVQEVFAAGADDYLVKPIVQAELVTRVENRLERFRLHQALADTDTLTGVANRRTSGRALGQLICLAQRFGKPLCLAELDLDHFKKVNDRYGHAAGDAALRRLGEVLRRSFRGEDIVARWGGEEFVVGMYGLGREAGVKRIGQLLEQFKAHEFEAGDDRFNLTFSAGVAQYPADGEDVDALYRAADEALYRAKAAGRDQVMPAGDPALRPQEVVDVVIIEDDEAMADVIASGLSIQGYSLRRFSDGADAFEALSGRVPATRAGVILLDVELPGMDGFEVLDRIGRDGVLRDSRVLMLTSRTSDADVLKALELGAFDHMSKPFSVPVLLQKVQRARAR